MSFDRAVDPVTGDYLPDGNGGTVYTEDASTAVHHAIKGRPWWGDRSGSHLHELTRLDVNRAAAKIPREIERSLAPLVDGGLIRSVSAKSRIIGTAVIVEAIAVGLAGAEIDIAALTPFGRR